MILFDFLVGVPARPYLEEILFDFEAGVPARPYLEEILRMTVTDGLSWFGLACLVLSCLVLSRLVLSCLVLSCLVLSRCRVGWGEWGYAFYVFGSSSS